jgi:hypothetical protein
LPSYPSLVTKTAIRSILGPKIVYALLPTNEADVILSDRDLRERLARGDLVVEPLADPELQIQPATRACASAKSYSTK